GVHLVPVRAGGHGPVLATGRSPRLPGGERDRRPGGGADPGGEPCPGVSAGVAGRRRGHRLVAPRAVGPGRASPRRGPDGGQGRVRAGGPPESVGYNLAASPRGLPPAASARGPLVIDIDTRRNP